MKKLFFFRSSTDKQVCSEHSSKSGLNDQGKKRDEYCSESLRKSLFKTQNHEFENESLNNNPGLRRSRSFSSAALLSNAAAQRSSSCLSEQSSSPSSSSSGKAQHNHPSRSCTLTPERQVKTKRVQEVACQGDHGFHKPVSSRSSRGFRNSSGNSSFSCSSASNEVLDLYIDGEQQNERSRDMSRISRKDHAANVGDKKPPRIHSTAPASPTGSVKGKSRSHTSRGARGPQLYFPSRDWTETAYQHESPRDMAKRVAERLSQTHISPEANLKEYDSDVPITIEDVYSGSLNRTAALKSNFTDHKGFASGKAYTSNDGDQHRDCFGFEGIIDGSISADAEDDLDFELKSKLKKAQERIWFLSEELEQESFLRGVEFNVPALVQKIKSLTEDKVNLTLEVSAALESQLADRASIKQQLTAARSELDSRTRRLLKEKDEMQSALEKELDRRSSDWSSKVEKYQVEEQRLRERVRELAEQNVSLQREVSSLRESETERRNLVTFSEKQVQDLTSILESSQKENHDLHRSICELQDKYKASEENRDCLQNTYEVKDEECKELHSCVTRLLRTCCEQEKTIDGLRELVELVQKKHSIDNSGKHLQKLQMEQIRLVGVEQALRREVDSYKIEADSLRNENISLLNRLKDFGEQGGSLTFRLDQELCSRLNCLQKHSLSLLNDSTHLCSKLLESLKRVGQSLGKKDGMEVNKSCLDSQFIIDSEVKVQGLRRAIENLMRGLQNISSILEEKSGLVASESHTKCMVNGGTALQNGWNSQDLARSELKAEMLLTSLLREKLFAKDQEVEQLQAELAAAARGNDILRCEVQNAIDSLSCVTHKMKDLELKMMKKEEKINQLQTELQESTKELTIIKGILPKVTEERDMMWQQVKQYTENNMLLNSEVNMLKKRIEALDEDVLLKEGQITILKDSLGSKSFDLLTSPDQTHEFLLE